MNARLRDQLEQCIARTVFATNPTGDPRPLLTTRQMDTVRDLTDAILHLVGEGRAA